MKRRNPVTALSSSRSLLNVFSQGSALAGIVALGATLGCSGAEQPASGGVGVGSKTQPIVLGPDSNVPTEFKSWSPVNAPNDSLGDGAFCTPNAAHSMVMFTRDTANFIQGQSNLGGNPSVWAKYGSGTNPRQLGGRPACGFVSEASSPYPFILLAKGAYAPNGSVDQRLFWSKGNWTASQSWPPPAAVTPFAALDSTQYYVNGNPAVGTNDGELVVVYLNDSGQLLGNYWTGSSFSGTLSGPTLPGGWTGVGTPTIAYAHGWADMFIIFVRAQDGYGNYQLFDTFFQDDHFTAAYGGPDGEYQWITLPYAAPPMDSDPAYEYDYNPYDNWDNGTLYYRSTDGLIYQVSASNQVDEFDYSTVRAVLDPSGSPTFLGNPVANGGVQYEAGSHWLLVRDVYSTLYFGESYQDYQLTPN
jgi:hypothetical protein